TAHATTRLSANWVSRYLKVQSNHWQALYPQTVPFWQPIRPRSVGSILACWQMESGSMSLDYSKVGATQLLEHAAKQVASLSADKNLAVVVETEPDLPAFDGDDDKLRRVLVNLIGNAIKFTPSGGTLTLKAHTEYNDLVFSVTDTGEGIPAESIGKIFEKFGQVESRKGGRTMSTGLGLTFCKLAVLAHGGHIDVTSIPGVGSTFSFTIPLTKPTV
ncbi:MAG: HAMP domain-containing sensor histidine kinase, partial [Chthonomonadales bacterium]